MQKELQALEKKYSIDWRKKKLEDLFDISGTKSLDAGKLTFVDNGINFIGRTFEFNGVQGKIVKQDFEPNEPFTITATVIGNYKYVKYQKEPYYTSQNINKLTPKFEINEKRAQFFMTHIQKFVSLYDGQQGGYKLDEINNFEIVVPYINNEIAFAYIEEFLAALAAERLAALAAYFIKTNLNNYILTKEEKEALKNFDRVEWGKFSFNYLFNNIQQGKRLTKADQIDGNIPFVMAGTTNTGVVKYISNPVRSFPKNSITIDIFGNTFYRNYIFGAGDDTGVFWNDDNKFDKYQMLFLTAQINKALAGKYDYGYKLRSSQTTNFEILLPVQPDHTPDFAFMTTYIKAMQKIVIKNVVEWADRRIAKTKLVIRV